MFLNKSCSVNEVQMKMISNLLIINSALKVHKLPFTCHRLLHNFFDPIAEHRDIRVQREFVDVATVFMNHRAVFFKPN